MGKYKNYNQEFRQEAVNRCEAVGKAKASEELGVSLGSLHRWCKEFSEGNFKDLTAKATYEELVKENKRLKKELGYVEEINRVLKKSTAIFSRSELGGLK